MGGRGRRKASKYTLIIDGRIFFKIIIINIYIVTLYLKILKTK
jgi:hypothetical protein